MKATTANPVLIREDGTRVMNVFIVADTTPETLPVTGEGIEGLKATDTFAPMSVLYVVADVENKVYIANENGEFIAQ